MTTTDALVSAAIDSVREHFTAAGQDIRPSAAVVDVTMYTQAQLPIWKLRLVSMEVEVVGAGVTRFNITAEGIYKAWPLLGGNEVDVEHMAQCELLLLPAELRARPLLQSTAYPRGCQYFAPGGSVVTGSHLAEGKNGEQTTLDVVIDMLLPIELRLEQGF